MTAPELPPLTGIAAEVEQMGQALTVAKLLADRDVTKLEPKAAEKLRNASNRACDHYRNIRALLVQEGKTK